jgi:hypothetical protein
LRVLLVHPEDSLRVGPWHSSKWDLVVDLGRSSETTEQAWREIVGCPVFRLETLRRPIEDARATGEILRQGRGLLVDSDDLDWWELTGLFVHAEIETAMLLRRLVERVQFPRELFATRREWLIEAVAHLANARLNTFGPAAGSNSRIRHYVNLFRKLPLGQITEIGLDKYDGGYAWRAATSARRAPSHEAQILLPSAYTNVSRMAAGYAKLLPERRFLLVATRRSGLEFEAPPNVKTAKLAAYAPRFSKISDEQAALQRAWPILLAKLKAVPELETLSRLGILDRFPRWFQNGIRVRDAWKHVLDQESIAAVLCGDDSNWYTRLPVVLARRRSLPTVDFHHGAFDGRFLMKSLPSDLYLAKSEAERDYLISVCRLPQDRIVLGGPPGMSKIAGANPRPRSAGQIVYFSEPYDVLGRRSEEVYRELLAPLCQLAEQHGTSLVLKLHPFESLHERRQLVERLLAPEVRSFVQFVNGPLTGELLRQTWFGITVESTTVVDCTHAGVPCFLCAWLGGSHFGYVQQFAHFGIGRLLGSAAEIPRIPQILRDSSAGEMRDVQSTSLTGEMLGRLLGRTGNLQAQPH